MVGERWKIGYIIEGKAGKYPKDRVLREGRHEMEVKIGHILKKNKGNIQKTALGEGRHEMERKVGHILKKEKENIQKTGRSEKEDMKWNGKLDIK